MIIKKLKKKKDKKDQKRKKIKNDDKNEIFMSNMNSCVKSCWLIFELIPLHKLLLLLLFYVLKDFKFS